MKKITIYSLSALTFALGLVACGNNSDSTASTDSTTTATSTATTTQTSTNNYAARADSFRMNSEAGNYLDARTGKPIKISVDTATGRRMNAETGEPVWHYVDKRTWGVYGSENWDTIGTARMENDRLMYRGDNDRWMSYDERWKAEDEKMSQQWKVKKDDGGVKMESQNDDKVKIEGDGDTKIKTDDVKIKSEPGKSLKIKEKD